MKRILPPKDYYNEEYIEHARYINLPWLTKALKMYQRKTGTQSAGGIQFV